MSYFQLHIQTDNAAFGPTCDNAATEIARILRHLADVVERQGLPDTGDLDRVYDYNGNTAGHYHHTEY